jgi:hypothetical protein
MEPISHVKLFRGGRLPDADEPIVIVTFEQTEDDFFFAEYFILYEKSQNAFGCRLSSPRSAEDVKEFLQDQTPDDVIQERTAAAQAEIEGKVVESLQTEQQQQQWILGAYTLKPIEFKDLRALWIRGRFQEPIRQMARLTRPAELKRDLERLLRLPDLKFNEEKLSPR